MSTRPPDLSELVGEVPPEEMARLERVHRLLLEAGAPPELPPGLRPVGDERVAEPYPLFPRRRWAALAAVAAAIGLAAFGTGYLVGDRDSAAEPVRIIVMTSPEGAAAAARASLAVFGADDAGNWPMELSVRGLATLPQGETYELWLTRDGAISESCGTFVVGDGTTNVRLNAPYELKSFTGWVVTRAGDDKVLLRTETL